jgi:type II secretory pathway component PulF
MCPAEAVAMIKAAEKIDQVPETVRSIEVDMVERADGRRRAQPMSMIYPLMVLYSTFIIIFGLCIFIVPTFAMVLSDLSDGTALLPVSMRILLSFTEIMVGGGWVIAILIITFPPLWGISVFVRYRWRRSGRLDKPPQIAGFIKWHLPFVHWFELNYSLLKVVGLLKASLRAGCTVDRAIAGTLDLHINPRFRKRLSKWLSRVQAGENIASAARASRIPNAIAWAFDDKINKGNTLTILEMIEDFYRSNYNYKANMIRSAMCPTAVVLMGSVVGFVIYAMFASMVSMTSYMISNVTP